MVIDMTNELTPILYGFVGMALVSGLPIAFAAIRAHRRQRPSRVEPSLHPVPRQTPRGLFVSPRVMHAISSHAH